MKCYEWLNKQVGDYDVFVVADQRDAEFIVQHFATEKAKGCKSNFANEWYYFVNSKSKTITPMPILALAFGGQYNGDFPVGKELPAFSLDWKEYTLCSL